MSSTGCEIVVRLGELTVNPKFGDPRTFRSYEELTSFYFSQDAEGKPSLHPLDLKSGVAEAVVRFLEPVAKYFEEKPENYNAMTEVLKTIGKLR